MQSAILEREVALPKKKMPRNQVMPAPSSKSQRDYKNA